MSERKIIDDVRDQYAGVARGGLSNESTAVRAIAAAFGYTEEQLSQLPSEANMGLSCGNPVALAGIRGKRACSRFEARFRADSKCYSSF